MKTTTLFRRLASWQIAAAIIMTGGAALAGPAALTINNDSDISGVARDTDPLLVNPWGLTTGPEGNLHVADNATGVETFYAPLGLPLPLASGTGEPHSYTIPQAAVTSGTVGSPTGVDVNLFAIDNPSNATDFPITNGTNTGSSRLLYCTEDGVIAGYRDDVNFNSAVTGADESGGPNPAGYTGSALSWQFVTTGSFNHQLYAANFRQGKIDVFNNKFSLLTFTGSNSFTDPTPPAVPAGVPAGATWSPFNIHRLDFKAGGITNRRLVVVYALHTAAFPMNDIPGYGYANIFSPNGAFDRHLILADGTLSSPWGIAIAHRPIGKLKAPFIIFIGNHGNGQINAFTFNSGTPGIVGVKLGTIQGDQGPLSIDGLWTLHFGTAEVSAAAFAANPAELTEDITRFYFSAGILGETHGLVGHLQIQ